MKINYLFLIFVFFLAITNLKADEVFNEGKKIFLEKGNCATCHMLSDAKSQGNIGPNLNQVRPDFTRVMNVVSNGIGVMPAYEGELTTEEIKAVSHYVATSVEN